MQTEEQTKFYLNLVQNQITKRKKAINKMYFLKKLLGIPQVILNSVSIASISSLLGYDSMGLKIASLTVSSVCLVLSSIQNFFNIDVRINKYKNQLDKLTKVRNKLNALRFRWDERQMGEIVKELDNISSDDSELAEIIPEETIRQASTVDEVAITMTQK